METFGLIILAGGASKRLGQPKQLLLYNGQSLLKHAVDVALQVAPANTFVVLGANVHIINKEIADLPVHVIKNTRWKEGMASSIHVGLTALMKTMPAVENVMFMVCDQPFVSTSLLQQILTVHEETSKNIIASSYNNTIGIPVLFNNIYFSELLQLKGAEGAKQIVHKYRLDVFTVPFSMGHIDIDNYDDYQNLIEESFAPPR